jgi:fucose 4-O-acetylase-like acetyltransferase
VAIQSGERDRFMDAVRVLAVLVVVAGHWFVVLPYAHEGLMGGTLLYQVQPAFWPLTWIFEVLPLLFFVGGFANHVSYHAGDRPAGAGFRSRRLRRLLGPTLIFLLAWAAVDVCLQLLGIGAPGPVRGLQIGHITPFESLWFVPVYLGVVLLSPATMRLHRRLGWAVPALLLTGVALTDLVAWRTATPAWLLVNLALVWLLPHQLGYFYAEGRLQNMDRRLLLAILAGGLGLTALLTSLPFYGRNLLDSGYAYWGVTAPTLPFALLGVWAIAAVLLVRPALARCLRSDRAWAPVQRLNGIVMTLFLWHMTAYFAVLAVLASCGLPLPPDPTAAWWAERPLFLALPAVALVPLVWAFSRFERAQSPRAAQAPAPLAPTPL